MNPTPQQGGAKTPRTIREDVDAWFVKYDEDEIRFGQLADQISTMMDDLESALTASLEREKKLRGALEMALEAQNILSRILHSLEARGVKLSSAIQYRWGKSTELEQIARALLSTQGGPTT